MNKLNIKKFINMDISKCSNKDCPIKEKCYRWTATPNEFRQAYCEFEFKDGECEYFWINKREL